VSLAPVLLLLLLRLLLLRLPLPLSYKGAAGVQAAVPDLRHLLSDASITLLLLLPLLAMCNALQVRQLMFFILATSSVMDAMDSLAASATAALSVPTRSSRKQGLTGWTNKQQQQQQQQQKDAQLLPQSMNGAAAADKAADIEAGAAAAAAGIKQQQQQQHDDDASLSIGDSAAAAGGPAAAAAAAAALADEQPAAAAAAAEPSCGSKVLMSLRSSFGAHTAWIAPWLPLAQNRVQFAHLKLALTRELPAMLSSKEGKPASIACHLLPISQDLDCIVCLVAG
jgi:hypothetical protein